MDPLEEMTRLNNELISTQRELQRKNAELENSYAKIKQLLSEIKVLKGLLPICMYCKKIRDENDEWMEFEQYIHEHTNSEFSHGICSSCVKIHFKDI